MPKHGAERGWCIKPGSLSGPGWHSEAERWCSHCGHWCPVVGAAGGLHFIMMHDSKECVAPVLDSPPPAWLRKLRHFGN